MTSKDDIIGHFQLFNIEPSADVISKCLEMCLNYNVDAEELIEQWFAYTSSVLRGSAPTVEYLERMERKEFLKTKEHASKKSSVGLKEQSPLVSTSYQINADSLGTPKANHAPVSKIQTPLQSRRLLVDVDSTPSSPISSSYSKRNDSRSVRYSYGPKDAKFQSESKLNPTVKPVYEGGQNANQRFMYEILGKRGRCINNMTEDLLYEIKKKYINIVGDKDLEKESQMEIENEFKDQIKNGHEKNIEHEIENETIFHGRIVSDSDGKINNQSVLLELTQRNKGRTLYLNLSKISKYSLFPGQVVIVKGTYEKTSDKKRNKILVKEICCDTIFNLLPDPPVISGTLQLLVASGPFTTQDSLSFEPLHDLLLYAREYKPNLLLLMGPFYERSHPGIMNGQLKQTFDLFFYDIVDKIMKDLENINVHVIVMSSQKEPHHFPVYPTPRYEVKQKYENFTLMPDPCMIDVNGLIIGATTADILFDISNFEMCLNKTNSGPPDRMARMASHLLKQRSFYPLDPPNKDMCIDMGLMETNGIMDVKPHLLILPSNLRHFVKEVDDCVIINPERLTKGKGGGTFARIEVVPGSTTTICGRTACQIIKI